MNADETLLHREDGRLWRIEMVRGAIPVPKRRGGGEWECFIVRWSSPDGEKEHSTDQAWAAERFYGNARDELLDRWGTA